MAAILYILLYSALGYLCLPPLLNRNSLAAADDSGSCNSRTNLPIPTQLLRIPAGMILGLTLSTTLLYLLCLILTLLPPFNNKVSGPSPLTTANALLAGTAILIAVLVFRQKHLDRRNFAGGIDEGGTVDSTKKSGRGTTVNSVDKSGRGTTVDYADKSPLGLRCRIFFGISLLSFLAWALFLTFFVFYEKNGVVSSGYTVFSDYSPHTAVISSFAKGNNFPAQYPHFTDAGMRYHFFFFFLCGNLQFLGLPITWAMNLPSIIGIMAFACLSGGLAVMWSGRRAAFPLPAWLLFLRGSGDGLTRLVELWRNSQTTVDTSGSVLAEFLQRVGSNVTFTGYQPHDDWGLWNMNVYANQRHFLWGMALVLILVLLNFGSIERRFWPRRSRSDEHELPAETVASAIKTRKDPGELRRFIISLLLLFVMPYWHGSALIVVLLILFLFAIFSRRRGQFISLAVAAALGTLFLSQICKLGTNPVDLATTPIDPEAYSDVLSVGTGVGVITPQWQPGFIAPDKSLWGILKYLYAILGLSLPAIISLPFWPKERWKQLFSGAAPLLLIFACTISLTPDVTVNHKYILAAVMLINIPLADLIVRAWQYVFGQANAFDHVKNETLPDVARPPQPDQKPGVLPGHQKNKRVARQLRRISSQLFVAIIACLTCFMLTLTGVLDTFVYYNRNNGPYVVRADTRSSFVQWLERTSPSARFLTPAWAYHEFFFSGRQAWYGHPYYAWSAGYSTETREIVTDWLYNGADHNRDAFLEFAAAHNIAYVVIDDETRFNSENPVNEEFFDHFPKAYIDTGNSGIVVYVILPDLHILPHDWEN
ncbi:MAG: hypothetical protein GX900_02050 [Clostridiaceae bacterium]|nr:hypothetical protein [Clostridiaceae bacterium]